MEVNIFDFFWELQRFFPLDALDKSEQFSEPVEKINFDYDYFHYLWGKIYVNKYFDHFVDNKRITMSMLNNMCNANRTEKMILTSGQRDLYLWLKKESVEKLENEIQFLNQIVREAKQL